MDPLAQIGNHIESITFDCYGTLIDWEAGIREGFARIPAAGRIPTDELIDAYIRTEASIEQQGYKTYREIQALTMRALAINYWLVSSFDLQRGGTVKSIVSNLLRFRFSSVSMISYVPSSSLSDFTVTVY